MRLAVPRCLAALWCCLLLVACGAELDPQQARTWHTAQWTALAQAWNAGQDSFAPPAEPPRPWQVGQAIPQAYSAVLACRAGETQAWQVLEENSREQVRYATQLLEALYRRDAQQLGTLSAELEGRRTAQGAALEQYAAAQQQTRIAVEQLSAAWQGKFKAAAPDLDFDLAGALAQARGIAASSEAAAPLTEYHDWFYARLCRRYLGWASQIEPAAEADPAKIEADEAQENPEPAETAEPAVPAEAPQPPAGCDGLRKALQALEAALLARNALETQVQVDAGVIRRYSAAAGQPDDELATLLPDQRQAAIKYRQPRLAVAQARLALFSRVDALLSPAEDVLQTAVTREWQAVWPGNPLETNVYAYAGLPARSED
jgi:hypothetical protein